MKVHRLVVLPDYQGIGIGVNLLNFIAEHIKIKYEKTLGITSSITNLKYALSKSNEWSLKRLGRVSSGSGSGSIHNKNVKNSTTANRITYTFEYKNI